MDKKNRKAIFIDIDGTLTTHNYYIPPQNLEAMRLARLHGQAVFINTGRSRGNIPSCLLEQLNGYVDGWIAGSGTHILIGDNIVYSAQIAPALVWEVIDYICAHTELWGVVEGRDQIIRFGAVRDDSHGQPFVTDSMQYRRYFSDEHAQVLATGRYMSPDFTETFRGRLNIYQFPTFADCVPVGHSKAAGIQKVLELTGIEQKNTVAIGDSNNDRDMLRFCHTAVVVANAQSSVLHLADAVVASNAEGGVAQAIRQFLL